MEKPACCVTELKNSSNEYLRNLQSARKIAGCSFREGDEIHTVLVGPWQVAVILGYQFLRRICGPCTCRMGHVHTEELAGYGSRDGDWVSWIWFLSGACFLRDYSSPGEEIGRGKRDEDELREEKGGG